MSNEIKIRSGHERLAVFLDNIPYIVLLLLVIWNCIFTRNFFSIYTVSSAIFQCASAIIIALGMTLIIGTGGIDLSSGSVVACAGMLATLIMRNGSIAPAVAAALLLGITGGAVNGYFTGKFNVQPMIVTLSTMYIFRGVTRLISGGSNVSTRTPSFNDLTYIKIFSMPIHLYICLVVVVLMYILVEKTNFGQHVTAVGDNPKAAEMAGISVWKTILITYIIASLLNGFASLIEISMATGADPNNLGSGMELDAIAAVAIGGTPMSGGKPRILGTVAGSLILQIISMMINMNNIPYAYSLAITAAILLAALLLQRLKSVLG